MTYRSLAEEIADLAPAAVAVVHADRASVEAFGSNAAAAARVAAVLG